MSIEFWPRLEPQIRPTRLAINFLLMTARAERKVRLCVKLFDFFRGWILIRLTWNMSRFVSNLVGSFKWSLWKNYFGRIFQKFSRKSRTKTCKISPYFLQFLFYVRITLKKFTQVLSYVVFTQVRRQVHRKITKTRYGEGKSRRFVSGKPVLFTLGLRLTAPYSLGVLIWNFYQLFFIVSIEFWQRFEPQILPTRLAINFLFITAGQKGRFVCVWNCLIFFVAEYSSVWP